jgi:hypothetical protein
MIPNAPFPVAVCPYEALPKGGLVDTVHGQSKGSPEEGAPPMLVVGVSFAPRHSSGVVVRHEVDS